MDNQALAVVEETGGVLDMPSEDFNRALARRGANRKSLMGWVKEALVDGTDYGKVHVAKNCSDKYNCTDPKHFSKDSLRKPGAEKIAGMLGLTATFPTLQQYEDAALQGVEIRQIILRCHLVNAQGKVVSDGVGARDVEKEGGDLNKALKMAAKSAHIDATLRCAGLSEVFTQDVEDMNLDGGRGAQQQSSSGQHGGNSSSGGVRMATPKQVNLLRIKIKQAAEGGGCTESEVCQRFNIAKLEDMPIGTVNDALAYIAGG